MDDADIVLVVVLVFADGLVKPQAPGSLREPATTYLFPQNWYTLPLSFGLLMCKAEHQIQVVGRLITPPQRRGVVTLFSLISTVICDILKNMVRA